MQEEIPDEKTFCPFFSSFLKYLGVGAASTALVSGAQALSPLAALATTHKGATSVAHFSPTGSASGVNVVLVHGIAGSSDQWEPAMRILGERFTLPGSGAPPRAVAITGDGRLIAVAADDGTVRLWRAPATDKVR